ncbi:hypothetical protein BJ165DRAFT_1408077 [Panaeolus papilionaceus]|nr:hypothetical protein BJ165DRAFT_1408077 [Panaeolus papilionaceus]
MEGRFMVSSASWICGFYCQILRYYRAIKVHTTSLLQRIVHNHLSAYPSQTTLNIQQTLDLIRLVMTSLPNNSLASDHDLSTVSMQFPSTNIASKEALGGRGDIVAMEMSVAAKFVAFGYEKGDAEIWSLDNQMCSPLRRIEIAKDGPVQALAWDPQHDNVLFIGAPNGVLHKIVLAEIWKSDELHTGILIDDYIHCLGFEKDGRRLAVACAHKVGYIVNPIAFPAVGGKVDVHWLAAPPLGDVTNILNDAIPCDVAIKDDFIYVAHLGCLGISVHSISGGQTTKKIPSDNNWRRDQTLQRVDWFCVQNGSLVASSREFLSPRRRPCFRTMRMAFVDDETLISGSLEGVLMLWKPIDDFIPWSSREIQPGNISAEYHHIAVGRNKAGDVLHLAVDNQQTALRGPTILLGVLGDIRILDNAVLFGATTDFIAPSVSMTGLKPRPLPSLPPQATGPKNANIPSHPSSSRTHSLTVESGIETPKRTDECLATSVTKPTPPDSKQDRVTDNPLSCPASSHIYPPPPTVLISPLVEIPGSSVNANVEKRGQDDMATLSDQATKYQSKVSTTLKKSASYFLRESRAPFNAFMGLFLQANIASGRLVPGQKKTSRSEASEGDDLDYIVNLGSQSANETNSRTRYFTPDSYDRPSSLVKSVLKRRPGLPEDSVAEGGCADSPSILLSGNKREEGATSTENDQSSPVAESSDEQGQIGVRFKLSDDDDAESAPPWGAPIGLLLDPISFPSPVSFNPNTILHSTPILSPVNTPDQKGQCEEQRVQGASTALNSIPALAMPSPKTTYHTISDSAGRLLRVPVTVSMGQPQYEQS